MKADALLVLKPDILSGLYAWCSGGLARDTIRGVLAAYGDLQADPYEAPDSEGAVRWGLRNIARKVEARGWYTTHLEERGERLRSLRQLLRASDVADAEGLPTADLVLTVARALGFSLALRRAWAFSRRDFLGLYAKNTHFTRLAGDLRCYLEGQTVEVLLLRGTQELTSLHILKEILRRVVRYPTTHYDAVENLLHVSDPGAADWEYFEGLLTAGAATERGPNHVD